MMRPAVFLDRDGVLNRVLIREGSPFSPRSLGEFEVVPGAAEALARLRRSGFLNIVVTNQPGVKRGELPCEELDFMNAHLMDSFPIDGLYVCFHDDQDGCECRKPKPGLLLKAQEDFGIDLTGSYMVGDTWRDMEAGRAAGCTTILLQAEYNTSAGAAADLLVPTLQMAVELIVRRCRGTPP
jgi:D-glycero-D-manno-heptose 1,7-bisphosphate phosphatase